MVDCWGSTVQNSMESVVHQPDNCELERDGKNPSNCQEMARDGFEIILKNLMKSKNEMKWVSQKFERDSKNSQQILHLHSQILRRCSLQQSVSLGCQ